jgi:hypothetical protein
MGHLCFVGCVCIGLSNQLFWRMVRMARHNDFIYNVLISKEQTTRRIFLFFRGKARYPVRACVYRILLPISTIDAHVYSVISFDDLILFTLLYSTSIRKRVGINDETQCSGGTKILNRLSHNLYQQVAAMKVSCAVHAF